MRLVTRKNGLWSAIQWQRTEHVSVLHPVEWPLTEHEVDSSDDECAGAKMPDTYKVPVSHLERLKVCDVVDTLNAFCTDDTVENVWIDFCGEYIKVEHRNEIRLLAQLLTAEHNVDFLQQPEVPSFKIAAVRAQNERPA